MWASTFPCRQCPAVYISLSFPGKKTVTLTGEHCAKVADVVDAMRKSYFEKSIVQMAK